MLQLSLRDVCMQDGGEGEVSTSSGFDSNALVSIVGCMLGYIY